MRLSPLQYHSLTFREYVLMKKGYQLKIYHDTEQTRQIVYMIAATNWDTKKSKLPSIQDFMPLPTDIKQIEVSEADAMNSLLPLLKEAEEHYAKVQASRKG